MHAEEFNDQERANETTRNCDGSGKHNIKRPKRRTTTLIWDEEFIVNRPRYKTNKRYKT